MFVNKSHSIFHPPGVINSFPLIIHRLCGQLRQQVRRRNMGEMNGSGNGWHAGESFRGALGPLHPSQMKSFKTLKWVWTFSQLLQYERLRLIYIRKWPCSYPPLPFCVLLQILPGPTPGLSMLCSDMQVRGHRQAPFWGSPD